MKPLPALLSIATLFAATSAWAATAPAKPTPPVPAATSASATASTPAPAPAAGPVPDVLPTKNESALKLDDFISDVAMSLKLSDMDKKGIEDIYVADGPAIEVVLKSEVLSPFQKAQQVADLRNTRLSAIATLLNNPDRMHAFLTVEAKYRVALTLLAADGGLVATPPPPAK